MSMGKRIENLERSMAHGEPKVVFIGFEGQWPGQAELEALAQKTIAEQPNVPVVFVWVDAIYDEGGQNG